MFEIITINDFDEILIINIKTASRSCLTIGIVYGSPNSTYANTCKLFQQLNHLNSNYKNLIIIGDLNFPNIDWSD